MKKYIPVINQSILIVGIAFLIAGLIIAVSGGNPFVSFSSMFTGAFGDLYSIGQTLIKFTPLAITGAAIAIGMRGGLFNIGAEGQLLVGALAAAWIGYSLQLPAVLHVPLCLLAGICGGALWGLIPGLIRAYRGVNEVITTIMMNYIAVYLIHFLVASPMKDPNSMAPQTPQINQTAQLGYIIKSADIHTGIAAALLIALIFGIFLWHTKVGYEIRAVGLSHRAAKTAGINVNKVIALVMLISGAVSGLAGSIEVLGIHHKFYDQFSPGYGFDSIAVALLGNNSGVGVLLSALLFGALNSGALNMQIETGSPKEIVIIIQAVIIIFAGIRLVKRKKAVVGKE